MNIAVFGANGPTGREVVRQALAAGHYVTAVTRKPKQYPMSSANLDIVSADVTDADGVARALAGTRAVISTYGVPYSRKKVTVYSEGITNITQAMIAHRLDRLVCVSSTSIASGEAPGESLFWRKGVIPVLRNTVGRTLYDDMERMERIVQASSLDWTIVRPAGLFNASQPSHDYQVATGRLKGRVTSRADLAQTLVREATATQHPRSIIEVVTRSGLPSPLKTFLKEVVGVGANTPTPAARIAPTTRQAGETTT